MAQYFWTPNPDDLGLAPSDWTVRYGNVTLTVEQDGAGDYYLLVENNASERKAFTIDSIGGTSMANLGDTEIYTETFHDGSSAQNDPDIRHLSRFTGTTGGDTTCRINGIEDTSGVNEYRLSKIVDGTFSQDGNGVTVTIDYTNGVTIHQRTQSIGSDQKARHWEDAEAEPATWGDEITEGSVTQSGDIGMFNFASDDFRLYKFGVGTNGDPAPTEAVSGEFLLAGSINTLSSLSGAMDAQPALSGQVDTISALSARMDAQPALSGPINTVSTLSGQMDLQQAVAGTIASVSTLSGAIDSQPALSGPITTVSELSASMDSQQGLSGSIDTVSTMSGSLQILSGLLLSGSIDSTSSMSGALGVEMEMTGSIDSLSTLSGGLSLEMLLSGSVDTVTQLVGDAVMELEMSGQISAASQLSGALEVLGNIGFLTVDDVIIELNLLVDQSPELKAALTAASTTTASFTIDGIDIKPQ